MRDDTMDLINDVCLAASSWPYEIYKKFESGNSAQHHAANMLAMVDFPQPGGKLIISRRISRRLTWVSDRQTVTWCDSRPIGFDTMNGCLLYTSPSPRDS